MLEKNEWPLWLKELWPNWLENIGYPTPGVGDLSDLKFMLGVGEGGRWVGFINPGWYYHDNKEQYKFVQVGTITVSGASGSGTVTEPTSFRPNWGPVLIHGVKDDSLEDMDGPYREHHNSLYPATPLNWAPAVSGFYYASVPSGVILIGLRDLTNLPLGSVAGSGLIISNKLYWYDVDNNLVYVKPKTLTTPQVWADLLYTTPRLRMREIVIQEDDGVRSSYNEIENVKIIRGDQVYLASGFHETGFLTHNLTGCVAGDWVVMDYWISKSFILQDHKTIQYYCGGASGAAFTDTFRIYYETSVPDILPCITINDAVTGTFNVNPLYQNSYRSGYLFHAVPGSSWTSYWKPGGLRMYLDKDEVCGTWREPVKLCLYAIEENQLPLPFYPVNITVIGGSAIVQLPNNGLTDGRGEIHYLIQPSIGASSISVTGTMGSYTAVVSATVVGSGSMIDIDRFLDGHVNILLTNEKSNRGAFRTFTNAVNLDGIPRPTVTDPIVIESQLASEYYDANDKVWTQTVTTGSSQNVPNVAAIAELGYVPQPGDYIFGTSADGQSIIIRSDA